MTLKKLYFKAGIALTMTIILVATPLELLAQSARSRAMGGAFIAISNDESATYYNPAGLSQIQGREASIQTKVNERDMFSWTSMAFTGHIYEDKVEQGFSITDYLEHNILEEPIPRRPKYSYGVAFATDKKNEEFGRLLGGEYLGVKRHFDDLQFAFATRFPIARRMLSREQLYGGINFRFTDTERWIKSLQQHNKRKSQSMGAGLMYHYNDKITCGMTFNNLFERISGSDTNTNGISVNFGVAAEVTRGTTISLDTTNITNSANNISQQYRIGIEKKFIENDLTMRMGSHNGTLTLGFGMQILPHIGIDYAYYDGDIVREHYIGAHTSFD